MVLHLLLALFAADGVTVFNDDGGWCWFQDKRAIVTGGKLIFGSVSAGVRDPSRRGTIEITSYDLAGGARNIVTLHRPATGERGWLDDHNAPALLVRPDGRLLAVYTRHGVDEKIYSRVSVRPGDPSEWQPAQVFVPSASSRVTYSNLHYLAREKRLYNFFRGLDNSFKPSWMSSNDSGGTWSTGGILIKVPAQFRHRPYARYVSNEDTVHIVYTEGHPRDFDNSVYHVYYRRGNLHRSDGKRLRALEQGLESPDQGTRIFQGDPANVAWVCDIQLDPRGRPYAVYSVQKDSAGLPSKQGGEDHRFRYARWDGRAWIDTEIAYAGSKLYPGEDDYTGLAALDPHDRNLVFISTNVDPVSGKPLASGHREIFRGRTTDGRKFSWTPVTRDSTADNIRPLIPVWPGDRRAVLWLRGKMQTYTNYNFEIVGIIEPR